ncbi:MAG: SDR family NAD(P)-dependent oxidoreductase [Oscillatoriaceae cyanobacterium Prado104]|jgi:NAD(P)-dependent dehydrogenase (short-subunit alcohol dehydrogenase family)|nr:SDR family NAD(P)-dependent oxidoreductase [Oscillatoriaceae cyanobacterium Prado104]
MSKQPRCFACKECFQEGHFFYQGLCLRCGDLNWEKRNETANLQGLFALVTGARVKIGYAVTLRLLRAGAAVIATTRFARDAAKKYAGESDFDKWRDRLHIYELDLRYIAKIERFAEHVTCCYPRLDIIVNNAAQTVRRPPAFYQHLMDFETVPFELLPAEIQPLLARSHSFDRTLAGDDLRSIAPGDSDSKTASALTFNMDENNSILAEDESSYFPLGMYDRDGQQIDLRPFNSWLMKDDEVSILELLEVHIINAIAPFAINSRLKPLMKKHPENSKYIINISSKEGQFNGDKSWRHPHTNMAKAALNMMTRTCAKEYAKHKIYMNAVDPGWISFQHPHPQVLTMQQKGVQPPFDVIDAAARICDPIYMGVNEGRNVYGKLFKDYADTQW